MIDFFAKRFIKDDQNYGDARVRTAYGTLCSIAAIAFNVLLFAAKEFIGILTGSVAIMADAFNNLADAGSAVLMLVGFKFANAKPAPDRPFGHGRIEYITGLIVSALILVAAVELGRSSVVKIITPEAVTFSWVAVLILVLSIAVKFYMAHFTRSIADKIDSSAMRATAADYTSDTLSTFVVLVCTLLYRAFGLNLDGWGGALVSLFILWAGVGSAKETLLQLLGTTPDPKLVKQIEDIVLSYDNIVGIHDLVVHDYGPGRLMVSLHAEVPGNLNVFTVHDVIDQAMAELDQKLGCESVIHMDPICTDDEAVVAMRKRVAAIAAEVDARITIHDFRMVTGPTHTNVIFDAVIPHNFEHSDEEAAAAISDRITAEYPNVFAVIKIDKPYTTSE